MNREEEIKKEIKKIRESRVMQLSGHSYINLLESELKGIQETESRILEIIDVLFKEDYSSKWTQDFLKRLERGCFPWEAFDFIKKEIKQELTSKINSQQESGRLALVEETKQGGKACNSVDTYDKDREDCRDMTFEEAKMRGEFE